MNSVFWRLHRNKILAITFSALGIVCYLAGHLIYAMNYGWNAYLSSPFTMINILFRLVIYGMLLVTNIQNDNRAYHALFLFVFLVAFDMIIQFLPGGLDLFASLSAGVDIVLMMALVLLTMAAAGTFGVLSYIALYRYRLRRTSYRRLILWLRLFALAVGVESLAEVLYSLRLGVPSSIDVAYLILSSLPWVFIGVSCLFTMRRLRYD